MKYHSGFGADFPVVLIISKHSNDALFCAGLLAERNRVVLSRGLFIRICESTADFI